MPIKSLIIATAATAALTAPVYAGDLSIQIDGLRNGNGTIRVALHDGDDGFPGNRTPIAIQSVQAASEGVQVIFADLPAGKYAATLFHDENENETLDTNLLGIPIEGIAFSNNATGFMGPASFADASIQHPTGDLSITTTIVY